MGPLSHSLHLQPDELIDSWHSLPDSVADRAVTLGHVVDGQARAVAVLFGSPLRLIDLVEPVDEERDHVRGRPTPRSPSSNTATSVDPETGGLLG